jgi:hypothetical protein
MAKKTLRPRGRPVPLIRAFCRTHESLLGKLQGDMNSLAKELKRDYDKTNLEVFIPKLISDFNALQTGSYCLGLLAGDLGISGHRAFDRFTADIWGLQSVGFRLLKLMTIKGQRATAADFRHANRLISEILSAISAVQSHCHKVANQK